MADERTQAILFAEYYFALVDGIFPGFESHLAKNVVLDWFGRKIRGKKNVAAFIKSNKTSTLHVFTDIKPISDIVCNKPCNRKRKATEDQITDIEKMKTKTHISKQRRYKNAIKCLDEAKIIDYTVRKKSSANVQANDYEMSKENDSSDNFLEPEITLVDDEEIQRNINESKLEEEIASIVKPIKIECGQRDCTVRAQTDTVKYMKANGQVKFTRKVVQEDPWSYHWTSLKNSYWVQKCKLQIAYSRHSSNEQPKDLCMLRHVPLIKQHKKPNTSMKIQHDTSIQNKRPTLEEIIGTSNGLIPDVNNFGGYLKPLNYAKDRDDFLKHFEATVVQKNPNACLPTVSYVGNKLVFKYKNNAHKKNVLRKMYDCQIYKIVYEEIETDEHYVEIVASE